MQGDLPAQFLYQTVHLIRRHVPPPRVVDEHRRRHTKKRDITRERPLSAGGPDSAPVQLPSDDPTASQLAQANEVHERLMARASEMERTIIELRKQGYSTADIAEHTGWNIRKVQRSLKDLHDSMND